MLVAGLSLIMHLALQLLHSRDEAAPTNLPMLQAQIAAAEAYMQLEAAVKARHAADAAAGTANQTAADLQAALTAARTAATDAEQRAQRADGARAAADAAATAALAERAAASESAAAAVAAALADGSAAAAVAREAGAEHLVALGEASRHTMQQVMQHMFQSAQGWDGRCSVREIAALLEQGASR